MNLYSFKGGEPTPIPFSITLSNGFTRTDPQTFTVDELADAGFRGPIDKPPYDPEIETLEWYGCEYIVRPYSLEEIGNQWEVVRKMRNELLKESDRSQIDDFDLGFTNKSSWALYRQNLRDLPQNQSNPFDIMWPLPPSE